jgi:hypothetical protein
MNQELAQFLLWECIADKPTPTDDWSVDFQFWGIEPPSTDDELQYKIDWVEYELVPDPDDYAALMTRLYQCAGMIGKDQAKEFEAFFRFALERLASE